jgi:hypothetical protein
MMPALGPIETASGEPSAAWRERGELNAEGLEPVPSVFTHRVMLGVIVDKVQVSHILKARSDGDAETSCEMIVAGSAEAKGARFPRQRRC